MIFIVSGPSGSGKTTLVDNALKAGLPKKLARPLSFTSRPPRHNEQDGADYLFISEEEFRGKIKKGELLEWTKFLDGLYGTPRKEIDDLIHMGRDIILCRDIKGASSFKRQYPAATVTIFIVPPSIGELENRITKRSHKTTRPEVLKRLKEARRELKFSGRYDHVIENANIDLATRQLLDIIKSYQSRGKKG
ncbi:MAG: guanylate kinase [Candidatus Omnitrophica bacterium]|nr:guanylate kinase [Candidatus Omnitrophota bacterium]